jgi:tetratricopeptide (TPR) repeat protein/predicted aspartyl protease
MSAFHRSCWFAASVGACLAGPAAFAGKCEMQQYLELPVTMIGLQPTVDAKINGADVRMEVDSGAFYSLISATQAAHLKLPTGPAPAGYAIAGVGGRVVPSIAHAETFVVGGATMHEVDFLTEGGEIPGEAGLLGRNILARQDAEYDLSHGVVRLMRTKNCENAQLAYWAGAAESLSMIDLIAPKLGGYLIDTRMKAPDFVYQWTAPAFVNGRPITVIFDSGAAVSALTIKAAASIGIKPDSPGAVPIGATYGIGGGEVKAFLAPVSSFKIGAEEIKNTRLRVDAVRSYVAYADMVLGADFFLSHRIFIANNEHKIFFTYNGGPVFNLTGAKQASSDSNPASAAAGAEQAAPPATIEKSADQPGESPGAGGDAADHSRRGAAFAARRDFAAAIAELTEACTLAPQNGGYFFQRGTVYRESNQAALARGDFDRAVTLDPNEPRFRIARSDMRLLEGDSSDAGTDLDAAAALLGSGADERLTVAIEYMRANIMASALSQLDLWIKSHPQDHKLGAAYAARCRVRGFLGRELDVALADCDSSLQRAAKRSPLFVEAIQARGLVLLRSGDYRRSISAFDESLEVEPTNAWSLYGRGIAELRKQRAEAGQADIAKAKELRANVADQFSRNGIAP